MNSTFKILFPLAASLANAVFTVNATDIVWTNVAGGEWSASANWSPNQVPGASDNAYITNAGTYTVSLLLTSATNRSLTLGGAIGTQTLSLGVNFAHPQVLNLITNSVVETNGILSLSFGYLTGSGDLLVKGQFRTVDLGGTMTGAGKTIFTNSAIVRLQGDSGGIYRTVDNYTTVTFNGSGFNAGSPAIWNNMPGSMFDIQSNGTIYVYSPSAIFNNYGALKKSGGGGSSSVGMVVNNSGEVLVTSGLLSLAGGKSSGRFHADVNCTNQFTGPLHTLDVGASFIGAGVYRVCGGSLSSSVPFTVTNNFELGSGGQLTGTNTFVFAGPFSFREGNMVGPGKTVFRNTAIVSVSAFCVFGRTVDNYGIVRFESDPDLLATWNNMEGSITELRGQSLHAAVDNNAPFNNYGLLLKSSGGGTSQMNCSTTNWGIVRCQSGTLAPGKWSYVQKAGRTELAGGNYFGYLDIDRGILTGVGNIAGWVRNNGTNMPGASTTPFGFLSITNNQFVANPGYTNTGLGTLSVRLGGTTAGVNHDQMRGSGYINLNGFLRVSLVDGFLPSPGNIFTVMTYSARSPSGGKFTNSNAADLGLKELYLPTNLLLIAENAFPLATFSVNDGSTQSCCQPFELGTTALDLDGKVTNLAFYVEGIPVASLGGSDLTGFTNSVEIDFPGTYSLQAKATDDYGWSTWTTQQVTIVTRPLHMLSLGGMRSGGTFKFCMLGEEGRKYEVLANTNLNTKQWDVIGTMEYTNGIWRYFDTSAPSFPERYYQTRQLPLR